MFKLFNSKYFITITLFLVLPVGVVFADWSQEYVDQLDSQAGTFKQGSAGKNTFVAKMLPFADSNKWRYDLTHKDPEVVSNLSLGLIENIGELCIKPLVFDEEASLKKLYIGNSNSQIILYGLEGVFYEKPFSIMFRDGLSTEFGEGVILAALDEAVVSVEQSGETIGTLNGKEEVLKWYATGKKFTQSANAASFTGTVNGNSIDLMPSNIRESEFDLRLGSGGKKVFIARVSLQFVEGAGISNIRVQGDQDVNAPLGGPVSDNYKFAAAGNAFEVKGESNDLAYFACPAELLGGLTRPSSGYIANWFNIYLFFTVLLSVSIGRRSS